MAQNRAHPTVFGCRGEYLGALTGGGGSHQRTRLCGEFSLLSGKVQGISAYSAAGMGSGPVFRTINQVFAAKFPKQKNREFSRENREFPQRIRECPMSTGNTPARACTHKSSLPPRR